MESGRSVLDELNVISNLGDDIWHGLKDPGAYEWWHFDALSDDGREAVAIVFSDNYIYSPRYEAVSGQSDDGGRDHKAGFPAVSFSYFIDGRPLYRAVSEFDQEDFIAEDGSPGCSIGRSSFLFRSADYGSGYLVKIVVPLAGGRTLNAHFEWLSIESDMTLTNEDAPKSKCIWNIVAPRSDVSGRVEIEGRRGRRMAIHHFRGTGYHDHRIDFRRSAGSMGEWFWGRAHYYDSTAVFNRYREQGTDESDSNLIVVRDNTIRLRKATSVETEYSRDKYGIRYPTRLRLITEDGLQLKAKPIKTIQSSFYFLRFVSEITLMLRDGIPRKTLGISEFLSPRSVRFKWLNWITKLGNRKNTRKG